MNRSGRERAAPAAEDRAARADQLTVENGSTGISSGLVGAVPPGLAAGTPS